MQTVFSYEPDKKALNINKSEIYRYMGYTKGASVSEKVDSEVDEILTKVLAQSTPKVCYKRFALDFSEGIDFGGFCIYSKDLAVNLNGCKEAVIFAATIGLYTDMQIRKETLLSPYRACIFQAVGAAVVEAVCDEFNGWLKEAEEKDGNIVKPRFSPGYGDVSLDVQKDIFRALDCTKAIGITLTDSLLMIPEKSVTAIIGIR